MTSVDRHRRGSWLAIGVGLWLGTAGCKDQQPAPPPEAVARLKSAITSANDAGDRAFIVRAAIAILGRPPVDADEMATYLNIVQRVGSGREAVLDSMMLHPDYVDRWTNFVLDRLQVARLGDRVNTGCYDESPWWDAIQSSNSAAVDTPEKKEALLKTLGNHVAAEDAKTAFAAFETKVPTMRDLIRSAVLADDLRGPYRANLFAQMVTPLTGAEVTEANQRADFWQRFEESYINRQHLCLGCHNTVYSVTGPSYDFDRFFPTPFKVEQATYGCSDGFCVLPPDLHSDFRLSGVTGPNATLRPWGLASACGNFVPSPGAETCPVTSTTCFAPPGAAVRAPASAFAATNAQPSVLRLNEILGAGIVSFSLSMADIPPTPLRDIEDFNMPGTSEKIPKGARGMALMVAANIAERVFEEVHGARLTVPNHFPRSESQRNILHALAQGFMRAPTGAQWSLKYLLRKIIDSSDFNSRLRSGDEFSLGLTYDPWVIQDPRPDPSTIPDAERCSKASPSYQGCVKGVFQTNGCLNCHENPAVVAGLWDHKNFSTIQAESFASVNDCKAFAQASTCAAVFENDPIAADTIDCNDIGSKSGGMFAVRLSCKEGTSNHMPKEQPSVAKADRLAVLRWVKAGGLEGTPPVAPPAATPDQTNNGVGDMVHWKSGYQLTSTVGLALGLKPWNRIVPPDDQAATVTDYPALKTAEAAGHYLDTTSPGGRGVSYLAFLEWERQHGKQGVACKFGTASDRITDMVQRASTQTTPVLFETLVATLKQAFMGEDSLSDAERPLLELASGQHMDAQVTPANVAPIEKGLRQVCNVFMKSPLFMLSYVEPVPPTKPPPDLGWPPGLSDDLLNPPRWKRKWLALFQQLPASCPKPPWFDKPIEELPNATLEPPSNGPCPTVNWVLPKICRNRLDCRPPNPKLERQLVTCLAAGHGCSGSTEGTKVNTLVKDMLGDLRLPVTPPALDLGTALHSSHGDVPSPLDQRFRNNLLVLPFAGGTVTALTGPVKSYRSGTWKWLAQGQTISHGETLFIPEGTQISVQVGSLTYSTGTDGMERPLDLAGADKALMMSQYGFSTAWVVVANGSAAQTQPSAARDTSIVMGLNHGPPQPQIFRGNRPMWAGLGAGGGWYNLPFPLASDPKPAWAPNTAYAIGAQVSFQGLDYRCYQAHTSQLGWEPPKVYNLFERINAGSTWAVQVIYKTGDLVVFSGKNYKCLQGHQAVVGWEPNKVPNLWQLM
jgi:hypothetical protein